MSTPTISQLKHAIALSEQIEKLQAELASLLGGASKVPAFVTAAPPVKATRKGRRRMSAEAKAKIAAAQRIRWARQKGSQAVESAAPTPTVKAKKKRTISAAHRAKLAASAKARWAKVKLKNA